MKIKIKEEWFLEGNRHSLVNYIQSKRNEMCNIAMNQDSVDDSQFIYKHAVISANLSVINLISYLAIHDGKDSRPWFTNKSIDSRLNSSQFKDYVAGLISRLLKVNTPDKYTSLVIKQQIVHVLSTMEFTR